MYNHKCYIQRAEKEMTEKQSKIEEQEKSMIEEQDAKIDEKKKKKPPSLFVYGDIECLIDDEGNGTKLLEADLIRYAFQGEEDVSYACSGPECIQDFISALNNLTEVDDKDVQRVKL